VDSDAIKQDGGVSVNKLALSQPAVNMKLPRIMVVNRVLRVVIAALLLLAGVSKAMDPSDAESVLRFDGVPEVLILEAVYLLVALEIVLAWWLAVGSGKLSIVVVGILFAGFTVQLGYLYGSENAPSCGCLGVLEQYVSAISGYRFGIARNTAVMMVLATLYVLESRLHR
jgi:hypothetical protein